MRSVFEITLLLERYMPQKWIYGGRYTLDVVYEVTKTLGDILYVFVVEFVVL